jgi:FMN phosphatase YigB (HAD superfamily)
MKRRLWVFDVDGTLMKCTHNYSGPILESTRLMIEVLGDSAPDVVTIVTLQDAIDREMVKEINPDTGRPYTFSMDRFPRSRVRTYEELCRRAQVTPDPYVSARLLAMGYEAFNAAQDSVNIYPDAAAVTTFLYDQLDTIILLTRGDGRVQQGKITVLEDRGVIFHDAIIVDHDKREDFENLRRKYFGFSLYSVGDGYESDIRPALALGYRCVWKPLFTWEQRKNIEQLRSEARAQGVIIIQSLSDIRERYKELECT